MSMESYRVRAIHGVHEEVPQSSPLASWEPTIEHSVEHVYTVYTCHTLQFCDMQTSVVHNMVSFASTSRNT